MYKIYFTKTAKESLSEIDRTIAVRIIKKN